jgi:hypothetical protein
MEIWVNKAASFNVAPKGRYACAGVGIVATLPAAPAESTEVWFSGSFATNNMTIARNGATIAGINQDLVLDQNNLMPKLIFRGGDWKVSQ